MFIRNLMSTALVVTALASMYFITEASATEVKSVVASKALSKPLKLWYDEAAPDNNQGWVNNSIPMGNGYMGINLFGGAKTERIQITENSLYEAVGPKGLRRTGLNNFAEVYLDFGHDKTSNYERGLNLNAGTSYVNYQHDGVKYSREYFTSYPDKVMAIRLSSSKAGALSFTLRPTIPFLNKGKSGEVSAKDDSVTLTGVMKHYNIQFEGQFKVIPVGGTMKAATSKSQGSISVSNADSAVILIAVGTNYQFDSQVFLTENDSKKLDGFAHPHDKVTGYIADAAAKSYEQLLANHQADYLALFNRVNVDFGAILPTVTTDKLVDAYPEGKSSLYLEELAFQFGRYMLICSSRAGTLPPHLQGIWNVYDKPPWSSQYLHDTNVQMAYAPVFSANMPELFESYVEYFKSYMPRQALYANQYIKEFNPSQLDANGDNGWSGPFWTNPYSVPGKSKVAGFGTGAWIAQMFWDYYDFTRDEQLLAETVYPIMYQQANFTSRFVQDIDGALLAKPSSSPEQKIRNTIGTTFDQQMFYENHHNTLTAAELLGRSDSRLALYEHQLPLLTPIQIGKSGHIKEFRQEEFYGDIDNYDPHHRHASMVLGLYPGQLVNDKTPAWLDAAQVSLTKRTRVSNIGWARAERIAMLARIHDGEEAYAYYKDFLGGNLMHNLFNDHRGDPLFQADGNYGVTAGVAEMLLQSQDHVISPLVAIPAAWATGSYNGLLARGNFEVSAKWANSQLNHLNVVSKAGGLLEIRYPNVAKAVIKTLDGKKVNFTAKGTDKLSINSTKGQTYVVTNIPSFTQVSAPSELKVTQASKREQVALAWTASADAQTYNVYRAVGNAPDYQLIASDVKGVGFDYKPSDLIQAKQVTLKVTAVRADGRESRAGTTAVWLLP
ncbi:glycoside hydrolase family 95 protein [Colwellia sp. 6_MG-2023]|uniref:glycoside hydrolase family 95 protein n=1 Tax=Colwellia sp. 6_MG-2023 TaxID=3062676 RepID=UPI0026E209B6|nr:glycoside hydrolase family 95 protein [Colwellia sp. 6_MG-2023]MDO6487535.1 glycoside hydrolase family 95 protein [Colwellia sp. 6_MG-2023]